MPVLTSRTGPILIAFLIAAAACIHVARKIYRSGVEHHGSRILLLSALIDTALVALMLLLSGLVSLSDLMQSGGPRLATCFVVLSLFILPARSIWNYATVTQRIAQRLGLKPCGVNDHQAEVAKLADVMDIAAPLVHESASLRTPVVYGVHSRKAHLAIPTDWGTADARSREVMLCHELAHIRNRDVGFLTWSFAFLRDLKWMLVLAPAIVILSSFTEKIFPRQAILLYAACLCILWMLTNVVVKRRELLADRTVAMLINSGQIGQAVDELLLVPSTALYPSAPGLVRVVVPMQNWLADKALFSRRPMIWKLVLRLVESVVSPHPSARSRVKAIHERNAAVEQAFIDRSEAFWAGITLGLLGVFISLAGFWAGKFLLGWQDDERIERLCYDCLGCAAPMVIGYVALFFVLPAWAAVRLSSPTLRPVLGLATRYICALLGACCVSPLILLGGLVVYRNQGRVCSQPHLDLFRSDFCRLCDLGDAVSLGANSPQTKVFPHRSSLGLVLVRSGSTLPLRPSFTRTGFDARRRKCCTWAVGGARCTPVYCQGQPFRDRTIHGHRSWADSHLPGGKDLPKMVAIGRSPTDRGLSDPRGSHLCNHLWTRILGSGTREGPYGDNRHGYMCGLSGYSVAIAKTCCRQQHTKNWRPGRGIGCPGRACLNQVNDSC